MSLSSTMGFGKRSILALSLLLLGLLMLSACHSAKQAQAAQCGYPQGFLSTDHSELVDNSTGCVVHITGVNWFGFETSTFAPHGLWTRNWKDMLAQIKQSGFNTIRLPYSNQLFDPSSKPMGIDYTKNP